MKIDINVPQNWSAITLKDYLAFKKDLEVYGEEDAGYIACLFHHFCKLEPGVIPQLPTNIYTDIKQDLINFVGDTDLPLQRIIHIDDVKYGFEPNLSQMAYGAYLDLTQFQEITIDKNWAKIMSILYRPVVKQTGALYSIEPYNAKLEEEKFLNVGMDVHFGALHFFFRLSEALVKDIMNSLKEEELPPNIKSILVENGEAINQLLNLQETIY